MKYDLYMPEAIDEELEEEDDEELDEDDSLSEVVSYPSKPR